MVIETRNFAFVHMSITAFGKTWRILLSHDPGKTLAVTYTWTDSTYYVQQIRQVLGPKDEALVFSGCGQTIKADGNKILIPAAYRKYVTKIEGGTVVA